MARAKRRKITTSIQFEAGDLATLRWLAGEEEDGSVARVVRRIVADYLRHRIGLVEGERREQVPA